MSNLSNSAFKTIYDEILEQKLRDYAKKLEAELSKMKAPVSASAKPTLGGVVGAAPVVNGMISNLANLSSNLRQGLNLGGFKNAAKGLGLATALSGLLLGGIQPIAKNTATDAVTVSAAANKGAVSKVKVNHYTPESKGAILTTGSEYEPLIDSKVLDYTPIANIIQDLEGSLLSKDPKQVYEELVKTGKYNEALPILAFSKNIKDAAYLQQLAEITNQPVHLKQSKLVEVMDLNSEAGNILTYRAPQFNGTAYPKNYNSKTDASVTITDKEAPWLDFARSQIGVLEGFTPNKGPEIDRYLRSTNKSENDALAWCAAFVNWVANKSAIKSPAAPAGAVSWRNSGEKLAQPAYGSIAVMGDTHAGFVVGKVKDSNDLILLGGNQYDSVIYSSYDSSKMTFHHPENYKPNYQLKEYDSKGRILGFTLPQEAKVNK